MSTSARCVAVALAVAAFVALQLAGGALFTARHHLPQAKRTPLASPRATRRSRPRAAVCVVLLDGHVAAHRAFGADAARNRLDGEAFVDSVGVLRHALAQLHRHSAYDIDYFAYVVDKPATRRWHRKLEQFGWTVRSEPLPVRYDDIAESYFKSELNKSGCCGMDELLKLNVFALEEYDRVSVVDADVLINAPLDELWDAPPWVQLIFTRGQMDGEPFQGGLWSIKPRRATLDHMVDLIKRGAWYPGSGWEKSGIGWCYGGPTVQGMMPYYFTKVAPANATLPVSVCHYNHMGPTGRCDDVPVADVRAVHFTGACPKPFRCMDKDDAVCSHFTELWWNASRQVEQELGWPARPRCPQRKYVPMGDAEHIAEAQQILGV